MLIASRFWDDDGRFLGALSDPAPVRWDDDGPTVDPPTWGPADVRTDPGCMPAVNLG